MPCVVDNPKDYVKEHGNVVFANTITDFVHKAPEIETFRGKHSR